MKPVCYFLVGLPGSGKTTFRRDHLEPGMWLASTDDKIEKIASYLNSTYDSVFKSVIDISTKAMKDDVKFFIENKYPFIWDQTNLAKNSRKSKLSLLKGYDVICYVVECGDKDDHKKRLSNRPGKTIPEYVLSNMKLEEPTLDEGFSKIIRIYT
jgi:predicted kinase